jgi:UrcA family protein
VRAEDGQMRVRLSDLNLHNAEGAKVALQRIHYGADVFCQANEGRRPMGVAAQVSECVSRMSGKAVVALNAPLVTALYEKRPVAAPATVLASAGN